MSPVDRVINEIDAGLRTLFAVQQPERIMPAKSVAAKLDADVQRESARLMRINHVGEVCAQALYQGQATVARSTETRTLLQQAAREERDHLVWCQTRINELHGTTSKLAPLFYAGSFALGALSGLAGDRWSMGFLVETERQVEAHLNDHLQKLSPDDARSREILVAMRADEIHHAQSGLDHGAATLPAPVKAAMRGVSKAMTTATYWV